MTMNSSAREPSSSVGAALDHLDPATLERAAQICEALAKVYLSPEYAANQPLSSFGERFACGQCAKEIRALAAAYARGGEVSPGLNNNQDTQ